MEYKVGQRVKIKILTGIIRIRILMEILNVVML